MRTVIQLTALVAGAGLMLASCGEAEKSATSEHKASAPTSHRAAFENDFDNGMLSVLSGYLLIQMALANDEIEGISEAAGAIESAVGKLDPSVAPKEHAGHYSDLPEALASAASALKAATDLEAARSAFKDLSKPVSVWVTMAKPDDAVLMYCPMKKAGWVQADADVSNPYAGSSMLRCGERVEGQPPEEEHSHQG